MANTGSLMLNQKFDELPKESFWECHDLYQWEGFWYYEDIIQGMLAFQSDYEALSDDVILASSMKTGTTWLKALCVSIMGRQSQGKSSDQKGILDDVAEDDILTENVPHAHIRTLEYDVYRDNLHPDFSGMPSPRLFHTHLPYSALPDSIKNSDCKIVYIARNPKDTLVSLWHFFNKISRPNQEPYSLEKAYDAFRKGVHLYGPYFDHVLEYWSESLKNPDRILFLKYEELKSDPKGQVKRLASFLGRPFVNEDEVEKVLWRSSLERLKNLEVNKNGVFFHLKIPNSSFFRLGVVGDWKNYFTDEMKRDLDELTRIKLEGSGLHFDF
ncbi:cytosolic sulfotransferase 12-like [Pistacia vera]|uniref:cytosolic sulfotransferase 12-like n=1 Tax=Pistacia vera TaxID=55513 RepID=UPI001263CE0F|nr:cytosolic sulfotransferase 12-like [Pistacia vera]